MDRTNPTPACPTTFFTLPRELRDAIYAYTFTALRPATLALHHEHQTWLLLSSPSTHTPAILLACKATYIEATPLFHKALTAPLLTITTGKQTASGPASARRDATQIRRLSAVMPVLLSAPSIVLKVFVEAASMNVVEGSTRLGALLRWLAAVFAVRERALNCVLAEVVVTGHLQGWFEDGSIVRAVITGFVARHVLVGMRQCVRCEKAVGLKSDVLQRRGRRGRGSFGERWGEVERSWRLLLGSLG